MFYVRYIYKKEKNCYGLNVIDKVVYPTTTKYIYSWYVCIKRNGTKFIKLL